MKVRIYNTDEDLIDIRKTWKDASEYSKWLTARPEIKYTQTSNKDYLVFECDADAVAFKLKFGLYDK